MSNPFQQFNNVVLFDEDRNLCITSVLYNTESAVDNRDISSTAIDLSFDDPVLARSIKDYSLQSIDPDKETLKHEYLCHSLAIATVCLSGKTFYLGVD